MYDRRSCGKTAGELKVLQVGCFDKGSFEEQLEKRGISQKVR